MPKHRKRVLQQSSINNESIIFDEKSFKHEFNLSEKSNHLSQDQKYNQNPHNKELSQELDVQQQNQKSCCQSLKESIHNFYITMINYLQCDRILTDYELQEMVKSDDCKVRRKYTENYYETYVEKQARFGYSFDQVLAEKVKEEENKQKDCWTEFKRFICCEGANELDQIEEKWDEKYQEKRQFISRSTKYGQTIKTDDSMGCLNLQDDEGPRKRNIFDRKAADNNEQLVFQQEQFGQFANQPNTRVRKVDNISKMHGKSKRNDLLDIRTIKQDKFDTLDQYQAKSHKSKQSPLSTNIQKVKVRKNKDNFYNQNDLNDKQICDFDFQNGQPNSGKQVNSTAFEKDAGSSFFTLDQNPQTIRKQKHMPKISEISQNVNQGYPDTVQSIIFDEQTAKEQQKQLNDQLNFQLGLSEDEEIKKISRKQRKKKKNKQKVSFDTLSVTKDPQQGQNMSGSYDMSKSQDISQGPNDMETRRNQTASIRSSRNQKIQQSINESMISSTTPINTASNKRKDRKRKAQLIQSETNEQPSFIQIIPTANEINNNEASILTGNQSDFSAGKSVMSMGKKSKKANKLRQLQANQNDHQGLVIETDYQDHQNFEINQVDQDMRVDDGYLYDEESAHKNKPKTVQLKRNLYRQEGQTSEFNVGTNKSKKRNKKAQMRRQLDNQEPIQILTFDDGVQQK